MRRSWPDRLGALLPEAIRRDLFLPALADLDHDRVRRSTGAARHALAVIALFLDCLRLQVRAPRKDLAAMFVRDVRQSFRIFRREPGFAAAAVVMLALGVGANTALFAVVEAVLLRPLPFANASEVVLVKHRDTRTGLTKSDLPVADFVDLAGRQKSFTALGGYYPYEGVLSSADEPARVYGALMTPAVFTILEVQPAMGRFFTADDLREGAARVVVISTELWRTQLGSDPAVLSRSIQLGRDRYAVVGVTAPGFRFPTNTPTDVILPARVPPAAPANRRSGWIYGVGRLNPGVTIDRAEADFNALSQAFEREFPTQNQGSQYYTESLRDAVVGDTRRPLLVLLAAVGFVLLIACANVGNLLLARSLGRQQELAMRLALGASRGRLIAQMLTEALVLSFVGGATGVAVAAAAAPALATLIPQAEAIPGLARVGVNTWVLVFSLAASLFAALLFSALASFGLTRDGARGALIGQRRMTMSGGAKRAATSLVAFEIALAVVLLIGAGLTLRSFANLIGVNPGFNDDGVLTLRVGLPAGRYADQPARSAGYRRLFAAIDAAPGIAATGAAMVMPLTGNNWTSGLVRADRPIQPGQRAPEVGWQSASGGYFRALGIPLKSGRLFDDRDTPDSPPVVIISEAIAQRFFPGEDAVGKRLMTGATTTAEIVGVVGDIKRSSLRDTPWADLYFPFERGSNNGTTLFVKTGGDAAAAFPAVRAAIRSVEPGAILVDPRPLSDIAAESAAVPKLAMRLLGGFAAIALVLAAVGIYGVMSYGVRRRTRELGTRLALGASRGQIIALVMKQGATLTAAGLVLGLVVGLYAARAMSSVLYGVEPWDPIALGAAAAVLAIAALGASYGPARRASRVDPAVTLASE